MATENYLPFPDIGTLDELLDRARRGAQAGSALDAVKDEMSRQRDELYRKLLNCADEKVIGLRADLRAIERLAQSLLVKEAQGEVAREQLQRRIGATETPKETILKPSAVARQPHRRASGKTAK